MSKLQQGKGITLIALIVTIVVLLILAGVSIAVITGDDGIIKSANQAKTEQIGGTVEDRVAVWKAGKATSEYTHRETKTEDEMLNDLINDKLLFEDEIVSPTENSFINLIGIYLGYTSIQSIPENLFANCPNVTDFIITFEGCRNLTNIPEKLFEKCPNVTDFSQTFYECSNLTGIPTNLFKNCKKVENFRGTFHGCDSLTGNAPELWTRGTNSEENNYHGNPDGFNCFMGCKGLENYDVIPHYWKSMPE